MPTELPVELERFSGGANITERGGGLAELLNGFEGRVVDEHLPIVGPGRSDGPPGQLPPVIASGALPVVSFDGVAGAQAVFRTIKIPTAFVDSPGFHIHWSKSDDVDRSGESVRWVVTYKVFNGRDEDAAITPTVVSCDDTYGDAGTTTRVVHRCTDGPLVGLIAGYYIAFKVEKGTPGGSPMAAPGLVTLDFTYRGYVNR